MPTGNQKGLRRVMKGTKPCRSVVRVPVNDRTEAGVNGSCHEKGWITETVTGKPAKHVLGFPFPKIEMEDPKAGEKVMHNEVYTWYLTGAMRISYALLWIGSSLERSINNMSALTPLQGWPGVEKLKNRENFEKLGLTVVTEPVDLKGASIMTWRYMHPGKEDSTFAYVPMTRRVRQMSPANRSNALAGSDLCIDDGNGYDGKVQAFEWKLLRKQEAVVPYIDESPMPMERTRRGERASTKQQKILISGYEDKEWQGAPWTVMDYIWIKRPVYVVEARAKDPYYNYGLQHLWVEPPSTRSSMTAPVIIGRPPSIISDLSTVDLMITFKAM